MSALLTDLTDAIQSNDVRRDSTRLFDQMITGNADDANVAKSDVSCSMK